MKLPASLLALVLISVPAYAADVDGTWTGSVAGPAGEVAVSFKFKADSAKLTGTTQGLDGSDVAIKDGKIDGNNIAFNVTLDLGGMPLDLAYKGVVSPEQIKMSLDVFGMAIEFVLKKPAKATDIDGTWTGAVTSPAGEIPVTFKFKADGAKLTGTTQSLDGSDVAIKDGKIDGSNITFNVTLDFGGMPFDLAYTGVAASDQIKMTLNALGMPLEFVVKKPKP